MIKRQKKNISATFTAFFNIRVGGNLKVKIEGVLRMLLLILVIALDFVLKVIGSCFAATALFCWSS